MLGAYFRIPGTAVQGSYDEYLSYDSNGNILTLQRYGEREDATLNMLIDDLKYGYDDGSNKLLNVTDDEAHPSGFNDGNIHTQTNLPDFEYDTAGNLIRDRNKKITAITYNHLNQPKELTSDTGKVSYIYNANGNKVQKQVTENGQTQTTDYLSGFQYLDGKLDFLPHAEGYVKSVDTGNTTEFHYVYHYKDHLGNIRLSYGRDPETNEVAILKESHYYPFGLQHKGYVGTHRTTGIIKEIGDTHRVGLIPVRNYLDDSYRYTFGGKEEQPELGLNWQDYGARNYDAALGRWMNLDPLGELAPSWTPYRYGFNNPMRFIDPTGMFETRAEARSYRKEKGIKGRIQKGSDGNFSINDRKNSVSYFKDSSLDDVDNVIGRGEDGVIKSVFLTSSSSGGFYVQDGTPIWGSGTQDLGHKNGTRRGSIDMEKMPFSGPTGPKSSSKFAEWFRYMLTGLGVYNNIPTNETKVETIKEITNLPELERIKIQRIHRIHEPSYSRGGRNGLRITTKNIDTLVRPEEVNLIQNKNKSKIQRQKDSIKKLYNE